LVLVGYSPTLVLNVRRLYRKTRQILDLSQFSLKIWKDFCCSSRSTVSKE